MQDVVRGAAAVVLNRKAGGAMSGSKVEAVVIVGTLAPKAQIKCAVVNRARTPVH